MNSEFAENALRTVEPPHTDPENDWRRDKPLPKTTAEMVLGHEPYNRHDRRKAKKLLRQKAA